MSKNIISNGSRLLKSVCLVSKFCVSTLRVYRALLCCVIVDGRILYFLNIYSATPLHINKRTTIYYIMATCLGWTDFEGCGECIIPLSDSYYISSLAPECVLFICRELLLNINSDIINERIPLLTKSYATCSGYIYISESHDELTTKQLNLEYSKLVYIYTVGYWAAYFSGCIHRKDMSTIAMSIISINRVHDINELWSEVDKVYKMLGIYITNKL